MAADTDNSGRFAQLLRKARLEAGLSLRELAGRAGTSHSTALMSPDPNRSTCTSENMKWCPAPPNTMRRLPPSEAGISMKLVE